MAFASCPQIDIKKRSTIKWHDIMHEINKHLPEDTQYGCDITEGAMHTPQVFFTSDEYDRYGLQLGFAELLKEKSAELGTMGSENKACTVNQPNLSAEPVQQHKQQQQQQQQQTPKQQNRQEPLKKGPPNCLPFPHLSCLTAKEQQTYLKLYQQYLTHIPSQPTMEQVWQANQFRELQMKVSAEQQEFMAYLETTARKFPHDYDYMHAEARKYVEDRLSMKRKKVLGYPRYYAQQATTGLEPPQPHVASSPVRFECLQQLHCKGAHIRVLVPTIMGANRPRVSLNSVKVQQRFPVTLKETSADTYQPPIEPPCSQDPIAERLGIMHSADVVISSSGLKCLIDNVPPHYPTSWELPCTVRELVQTSGGTRNVVFVDQKFVPKSLNMRSRNTWYHKFATKLLLQHPLHGSKSQNPNEDIFDSDGEGNSIFELETFGTSAPSLCAENNTKLEPTPSKIGSKLTSSAASASGTASAPIAVSSPPAAVSNETTKVTTSDSKTSVKEVQEVINSATFDSKPPTTIVSVKQPSAEGSAKETSGFFSDSLSNSDVEDVLVVDIGSPSADERPMVSDEVKTECNEKETDDSTLEDAEPSCDVEKEEVEADAGIARRKSLRSRGVPAKETKSGKDSSITEKENDKNRKGINEDTESDKKIKTVKKMAAISSPKTATPIRRSRRLRHSSHSDSDASKPPEQPTADNLAAEIGDGDANRTEKGSAMRVSPHRKRAPLEAETGDTKRRRSQRLKRDESGTEDDFGKDDVERKDLQMSLSEIGCGNRDTPGSCEKQTSPQKIKPELVVQPTENQPSISQESLTAPETCTASQQVESESSTTDAVYVLKTECIPPPSNDVCHPADSCQSNIDVPMATEEPAAIPKPETTPPPPVPEDMLTFGTEAGRHITYSLWMLGEMRVLVRCADDGIVQKYRKAMTPVIIGTKLEYQPQFGAEQTTFSETAQNWISLYIRPHCKLIRARINAYTSQLMKFDRLTLSSSLPAQSPFQSTSAIAVLHITLQKLSKLGVGSYLLSHNATMSHAVISRATGSNRGSYDLHLAYVGGATVGACLLAPPTGPPPTTPSTVPWLPIDVTILLTNHLLHHRIPATFQPRDLVKPKKKNKKKKQKQRQKKS